MLPLLSVSSDLGSPYIVFMATSTVAYSSLLLHHLVMHLLGTPMIRVGVYLEEVLSHFIDILDQECIVTQLYLEFNPQSLVVLLYS